MRKKVSKEPTMYLIKTSADSNCNYDGCDSGNLIIEIQSYRQSSKDTLNVSITHIDEIVRLLAEPLDNKYMINKSECMAIEEGIDAIQPSYSMPDCPICSDVYSSVNDDGIILFGYHFWVHVNCASKLSEKFKKVWEENENLISRLAFE